MPETQATEQREYSQETVEVGILDRLTEWDDQRPWTVEDLIRDFDGSRISTLDAIDELCGLGLIHRSGDVIFPTRAAVRFAQLKW